ncbi:hypothetical protein BCR32DRAFT_282256 [Anaeromyces robustus]|uniref:Uncharacterized protein n=1 Tax=Anaeromyces robustus TaxID=1754192 RepID=A0A1Y1WYN4_9FUNG|nr:hypothetical protein BCR32DRAFT_282256 [Anaeromyces robustus]|eukprot:ORX78458.1 hypothetical protein BCR32DRAFT_282256 [Anaeromyces robustus]
MIDNKIFFTYIINIQIKYSYELNNITLYTYENITDCKSGTNYISVYDKSKILNKNEVLKIKNKFNLSYYCKNDICVEVNRHDLPQFIEIPDKEGNIKRYISKSYTYNDLKLKNYRYNIYGGPNIRISYKCSSDSQCLTNKCIDGACIFNKENPKCASKKCFNNSEYSYCGTVGEPSDNFGMFQRTFLHSNKAYYDIFSPIQQIDSNCIMLENEDPRPYIEFSDEKVNINIYIYFLRSCAYNHSKGIVRAFVTCNSDSECFFNKSNDNHCVFLIKNPPIEHINNNKCSSNHCNKGLCMSHINVPDDTASFAVSMETDFFISIKYLIDSLIYDDNIDNFGDSLYKNHSSKIYKTNHSYLKLKNKYLEDRVNIINSDYTL